MAIGNLRTDIIFLTTDGNQKLNFSILECFDANVFVKSCHGCQNKSLSH